MKKRTLSLALALIFLLSACGGKPNTPDPSPEPSTNPSPDDTQNAIITRAQWVQRLTDTMGYSKESDAEAYFTDVQAGHTAYSSVQTAAAYGLLDLDTESFNPDGAAKWEFIAVTAAKAVGLFDNEKGSELTNSDYTRLAADSGLYPDGNFNPSGSVTVGEAGEVLRKIKGLFTITIDPNHVDTVTIKDGVIDLTNSITILHPEGYDESDASYVWLSAADASALEIGTVYIFPPTSQSPYGAARKVKTIIPYDTETFIENEVPTIEEVVTDIDIQGVYYPDFSTLEWEEGITGEIVTVSSASPGYSVQNLGAQAQPLASDSLTFEIKGDDMSISMTLHELKASVELKTFLFIIPVSAALIIEETHSLSINTKLAEMKRGINLFAVRIPLGATGASVKLQFYLSIEGEVKFSVVNETTTVTWLNLLNSGQATNTTVTDSHLDFSIEGAVEAGLTFAASLNFLGLDITELSVFIGFGATAVKKNALCTDLTIYMPFYVKVALFPQLKDVFELYLRIDIWTEENSPLRILRHYEDGVLVDPCTRADEPPEAGEMELAELWDLLGGNVTWRNNQNVYIDFKDWNGVPAIIVSSPSWGEYYVNAVVEVAFLGGTRYRIDVEEDDFGFIDEKSWVLDLENYSSGSIILDGDRFSRVDKP